MRDAEFGTENLDFGIEIYLEIVRWKLFGIWDL
jgi:hypothetical protein